MANSRQARKRARQAEKHRKHNTSLRSMMRTHIKKTQTALAEQNKAVAEKAYKEMVPVLDSMVSKGLIHKNKAARYKSRMNTHLKTLAAA